MNQTTREALEEFEKGDNPTMQDMKREVWEDDWWYQQTQAELIEECKRIRHEEDSHN